MTPAAWLVARRTVLDRPWRSALLLLGYGAGVGIMIALLSVGDALLLQAQDRNLVAGGDVVVLPEGIDPAVIKVNGVTGSFLTIPNARFVAREIIGGPRFRSDVAAAAPQLAARLVYVRTHGRVRPATASAGIPSLDLAARAARAVTGGRDSAADRAWLDPTVAALADRTDHFHMPPAGPLPFRGTLSETGAAWAEWDYFNIIDPPSRGYAYLTLIAGAGRRGVVLVRVRVPGDPVEDIVIPAALGPGDLSAAAAAQRIGPARVRVDARGYRLTVGDPRLSVDLRLAPTPGLRLPPIERRQNASITGYVVPAVRAQADGVIRTSRHTLRFANAPAYHDHNWGTWRGVTWEWGEASSASGAVVYGQVHVPGGDASGGGQPPALFIWGRDPEGRSGGLIAALPVRGITYASWRTGPAVDGRRVRSPGEITILAGDGRDTATVLIRVWDALGSRPPGAGGAAPAAPVFLQMRGDAVLAGTIGGRRVMWEGPAASETFVRP